MAENKFKYDVFISYSNVNKDWVRGNLLTVLEKAGLKVCIDFRDFTPGKPALNNMRDSILDSRHTLLVVTDAYLKSGWANFENLLSQTIDPANRAGRIIPLLREKCDLPLELQYLTYVNFFDPDDWDVTWKQLIEALIVPSTDKSQMPTSNARAQIIKHISNSNRNPIRKAMTKNWVDSEENELKLIVSEETQAKMLSSIRGKDTKDVDEVLRIVKAALNLAEFDISQERVEIIMDEYFDTNDLAVYGSHASFRVRRSDGKIRVTAKTPKDMQLGLFSRKERESIISEETYIDLVKTGFWNLAGDLLPDLKGRQIALVLRVNNERRSFSLKRRGEEYALALDLFSFTNARTGEISKEHSEVEIEAVNQSAKRKLVNIRHDLVEIIRGFDYSRDSKYERGIKYFGIDKFDRLRWLAENLGILKGLVRIGIIATTVIVIIGIVLTLLLSH